MKEIQIPILHYLGLLMDRDDASMAVYVGISATRPVPLILMFEPDWKPKACIKGKHKI